MEKTETGTWQERFAEPDRRYAIYQIIHDKIATEPEKKLQFVQEYGFAGVVGNVDYTVDFPDNEAAWERTEQGFRRFGEAGLHTWIYDEKGYPSGTAGGAVLDRHPEYCAEGLYCYEYWKTLMGPCDYRADVPGDVLYGAMLLPLSGGEAIDVTAMQDERGTLRLKVPEGTYHLFMMSRRRLFDGTHAAESFSEPRNYISLSDKEATQAFLDVTHRQYAGRLSDEFGKSVRAFFTDEPSLIAWNIRAAVYPIVPWHHTYPALFSERYGYPISLAVVAVVTGRGPELIKRRCDFWDMVADTVADNYFGTIQDWCRENGLKSSGHLLREENLREHVYTYGSLYRSAARMDWPGIDMLCTEPQQLMDDSSLPIARLLASHADISGEKESFTEFSDMVSTWEGKQVGIDWVKASVNYHTALGINNFTSYYGWDNYDKEDVRALNRYTARLGTLLREGDRASQVAVLYPEAALWAAYTPSVEKSSVDNSPATVRVNDLFRKTSWELLHRQVDYDYVDERLIREGEIRNGALCVKNRAYRCVVLPGARVLAEQTAEKLPALLKAGVSVICVGDMPSVSRDTGAADWPEQLKKFRRDPHFALIPAEGDWHLPRREELPALPRPVRVIPDNETMVLVGSGHSGGYENGELISPWLLTHRRVCEDGRQLLFMTNMNYTRYTGTAWVAGGHTVSLADPRTGTVQPLPCEEKDGGLVFRVDLRPYDGFVYVME